MGTSNSWYDEQFVQLVIEAYLDLIIFQDLYSRLPFLILTILKFSKMNTESFRPKIELVASAKIELVHIHLLVK